MLERPPRTHGIVLVSVMFLAVLVGMYVVSSFLLTHGQLNSLKKTSSDRLAEEAARSGIEYALARLQENPQWRGDGDGVIVDSPGLSVREDQGNVVGLIRSADGGVAQFRLRFNYQDGPAGQDDLDDPSPTMRIESSHLSFNNLLGWIEAPFPLADGPGGAFVGRYLAYPVPPGTVALVCEGRVAGEFVSVSGAEPNPTVARLNSVRVLEEFYRIDGFSEQNPTVNAVTMAGRRFDATLYQGDIFLADLTGGKARMRARQDFRVGRTSESQDGLVDGPGGEVLVPTAAQLKALLGQHVEPGEEDLNTSFYELAWDQVSSPREGASLLPAGVYIYRSSGPQAGLRHYDMSFAQYKAQAEAGTLPAGDLALLPDGFAFIPRGSLGPDGTTSTRHRFWVTEDIQVTASGNTADLTIMPASGAKEDLNDSEGFDDEGQVPVYMEGAVSYLELASGMNGQELASVLKQHPHFYGYWDSYIPGQQFSQAPVHRFLLSLADTGQISIPGQGHIFWDDASLSHSVNFEHFPAYEFFDGLMSGELVVAEVQNANHNVLTPLGVQIENPYGTEVHAFDCEGLPSLFYGSGFGPGLTLVSGADDPDNFAPQDFELTFAPNDLRGVRLESAGNVMIAADVRGEGASIKAQGQIRLVGMGVDIDADTAEDGPRVSLYATDDIVISTLRPQGDQTYEFVGLDLKGILYSWRDIELKTSAPEQAGPLQNVHIQGTMVAYGGVPGQDRPGEGTGGNITLQADQVRLLFDPYYLLGLTEGEGVTVTLDRLSSSYRN